MRKLFIIFCLLFTNFCFSQQEFLSIFKTNPSNKNLKDLVNELLNDKDFVLDTLIEKTDTTSFYLKGYYSTYNPFSFRPKQVGLQCRQFVARKDTFLLYQVIGITDSTNEGKQIVKQELKMIHNKINKNFVKIVYQKSKNGESPHEQYSYYSNFPMPDFTIGCGSTDQTQNNYAISIAAYFKLKK